MTHFSGDMAAIWIQPAGAGTQTFFLGHHEVSEIDTPLGDAQSFFCIDPAGNEKFIVIGQTKATQEAVTATIVESVADNLSILNNTACPFLLYINLLCSGRRDIFANYERTYVLEVKKITTNTYENVALRDTSERSDIIYDISANPPLSKIVNITAMQQELPQINVDIWLSNAYFATNNLGVYVSSTFSDIPGTQPTWTAINNIDVGGVLTEIDVFCVSQETGTQFVIVDRRDVTGKLYRRTNSTWHEVLNVESLSELWGTERTRIGYMTEDNGNLYVFCYGGALPDNFLAAAVSEDDGLTFRRHVIFRENGCMGSWPGTGTAWGGVFAVAGLRDGGGNPMLYYWLDGGEPDGFSQGLSNQNHYAYYDPNGNQFYHTKNDGQLNKINTITRTMLTRPASEENLVGTESYPKMIDAQFDSYLVGSVRGAYANHLIVSRDWWYTKEDLTPAGMGVNVQMIQSAEPNSKFFAMAANDSITEETPKSLHITSDLGQTMIDRSGIDPEEPLTTVSIPYTAGGGCMNPVEFVPDDIFQG